MRLLLLVDFANLYSNCEGESAAVGERVTTVLDRLCRYLTVQTTGVLRDAKIAHAEIALLDDQKWRPRWTTLEAPLRAAGFHLSIVRRVPFSTGRKRQQISAGDDNHLIKVARTRWREFEGVVLVSNDGDYAETIRRLRTQAGILAIVGSYETATAAPAAELRHAASKVLPLRDIADENDHPAPRPTPTPVVVTSGPGIEVWQDGSVILNFPCDRERIEIGRRSVQLAHFPDLDLTDYDLERVVSRRAVYLRRQAGSNWEVGVHPDCRSIVQLNGTPVLPGTVAELRESAEIILADTFGLTFPS